AGSKPEWDNSAAMREIVALRQEEARLLRYSNFAEVSLAPKMASSPAEVMAFLRDLARRARPFAEKDLAELREFAQGAPLESWDVSYWSE
ncbi:M3 family metallopeptidase, partial [Escherichia coli]|uniref:M3 family metallopeptidase n=2 Tax=Pseudomonadota TaxID=1224 RepID=UPI0013CF8D45